MPAIMDPQLVALLQHAPAYPPARTMPLADLRGFIRQVSDATPKYPARLTEVRDLAIEGEGGHPLNIRLYRPEGEGPHPVVLYFHGGGFILGDLDSQDMIARGLAEAAASLVLSVDYRLAPEHPYPAAVVDARTALHWAHQNVAGLGGDPAQMAVAGDSAGGVLAAVTAVIAKDVGIPLRGQALFYGSGGYPFEHLPSREEFKEGALLNIDDIDYFWELYLGDLEKHGREPLAGPRFADLAGVAPAYVLTAELDPTRDDGEDFGKRIQAAGGEAVIDRAPGMIHGFLSFLGAVDEAGRSLDRVGAWLRQRWN